MHDRGGVKNIMSFMDYSFTAKGVFIREYPHGLALINLEFKPMPQCRTKFNELVSIYFAISQSLVR